MGWKTPGEENTSGEEHADRRALAGEEVEEYDCGCKVHFRKLDYGEAGEELPRKPFVVSEYIPCVKHVGVQSVPPTDARLVKVRREYESFLNE